RSPLCGAPGARAAVGVGGRARGGGAEVVGAGAGFSRERVDPRGGGRAGAPVSAEGPGRRPAGDRAPGRTDAGRPEGVVGPEPGVAAGAGASASRRAPVVAVEGPGAGLRREPPPRGRDGDPGLRPALRPAERAAGGAEAVGAAGRSRAPLAPRDGVAAPAALD